jgi:hypothetical protein
MCAVLLVTEAIGSAEEKEKKKEKEKEEKLLGARIGELGFQKC